MFETRKEPKKVKKYCNITDMFLGHELVLEDETELEQFAMEFKQFPVKMVDFDEAFKQLKAITMHTMKEKGLLV